MALSPCASTRVRRSFPYLFGELEPLGMLRQHQGRPLAEQAQRGLIFRLGGVRRIQEIDIGLE